MKQNAIAKQRGAVLLMFAAAMIMMASWLAYSLMGDLQNKLKQQQLTESAQALVEAKENLLVFSESIPELYASMAGARQAIGYLPCPDAASLVASTTGSSGTCSWTAGTNFSLGRLPGQKLTGDPFFFSIHEKDGGIAIWYAVDDAYRYCGNGTNCFNNINPTTLSPTMTLDGSPVVAVLIAANGVVNGQINGGAKNQVRDATQNTLQQWDEYLESMTANRIFVSSKPNNTTVFNDQVIGVTKAELDARIKRKVCSLATNYCVGGAPTWFVNYGWQALACTGNQVNTSFCP